MADAAPREQQIRERCEKATTGPWEPYDNYVVMPGVGAVEIETDNPIAGDSSNDTYFIAHAREDVPYLLEELSALRARQQALEQALDTIVRGFDLQIFERNIDHDSHPGWAMRLVPYIQALAQAKALLTPRPSVKEPK